MTLNIQEITEAWTRDEPEYARLGKILCDFIKSTILRLEIFPEVSYRTKELLSIVKKIKKKQAEKDYTYADLSDKLGIRIICTFQEEMSQIDEFLKSTLIIKKSEYKQDSLDFNKLDYISNHYDATIDPTRTEFAAIKDYGNHLFEIQVRTYNQHAWSNSSHTLSYKQDADLPSPLKRRIYRLLSLYEIADDEFSVVNHALLNSPDNPVYRMLRKLEGKVFRFAKVDYDRETAFRDLKVLMSYLKEDEIECVQSEIESFIMKNTSKIEGIFDENRFRFHEVPFLTQPEIFFIWFAIENYPFSLDDNWANNFDAADLEQIKILWGLGVT